jgi:hypothetical protein
MEIMMDLAATLDAVHADQRAAGEPVRSAASDAAIKATRAALAAVFGIALPDELAALWRLTDGLDWNGVVFYGTVTSPDDDDDGGFWQSIVAANQAWRGDAANQALLIVADSDLDIFALDLASGTWFRADRIGHDRRTEFSGLERLLAEALAARL